MTADQYRMWEVRLHQLNLVNSFAQTCLASHSGKTERIVLSMLYDYIRNSITDEQLIKILDEMADRYKLKESNK